MSNILPLFENIRVALNSLTSSKLRAALTTLGIGIGIASVITLVSLGQSTQDYVTRQFLSAGSDLVFIRPVALANIGGNGGGGGNNNNGPTIRRIDSSSLTEKDVRELQDSFNLPDVKTVVPLLNVPAVTDYGSNEVHNSIAATTGQYFDILSRTVASGRLFDDNDVAANARVAVLGQTTVTNLFPPGVSPLGETVRINDVSFKVIGTLAKFGGSSFGGDQDDIIVIPLSTAHAHLQTVRDVSGQLPVSEIYAQAISSGAIDTIVKNATAYLRQQHKIKPGQDDDFQVNSQKDLVGSLNAVIGVLTVFLGIIGGVSLLVGGIGVMNIMLVTVTERTREIGLRKAVGAQRSDVLFQFLTEATVLCFVGATAGLIVSFLFILLLRLLVPTLDASISPKSIVLAVTVTTIIGIFFGMYPASRAAALNPIQALRSE